LKNDAHRALADREAKPINARTFDNMHIIFVKINIFIKLNKISFMFKNNIRRAL
jgi:hypothetical protein